MKTVLFHPIEEQQAVRTQSTLLEALVAKELNVLMACGGKGMCATCHVFVKEGMDQLSPRSEREMRTLGFVSRAADSSRLACQCKVLGEGVVVQIPDGMYIERSEDLLDLLGQRATQPILHPITGVVLIEAGKIITRSRINELKDLHMQVDAVKRAT